MKNKAGINQNKRTHSQKLKKKGHKYNIKGNNKTNKKGAKEKHSTNWKIRLKMAINSYLSIITLNVKGLNECSNQKT